MHVFVYGTLRKDSHTPASDLLRRLGKFVCYGKAQGELYDMGPYPAMVTFPEFAGDSWVVGEVWRLTVMTASLRQIDAYEGYSARAPETSLFIRRQVSVYVGEAEHVDCWTYIFNRSPSRGRKIIGGDYANYLKRRAAGFNPRKGSR